MIIESTDGYYYQDPVFIADDWVAKWQDDVFAYWDASKKMHNPNPAKHGFKGEKTFWLSELQVFLDGSMKTATLMTIELAKPIPTPTHYTMKYESFLPKSEPLLCWTYPFRVAEVRAAAEGKTNMVSDFLGNKNVLTKLLRRNALDSRHLGLIQQGLIDDAIRITRRDPYHYVPGLP